MSLLLSAIYSYLLASFSLPTKSAQKTFWISLDKKYIKEVITFLKKSTYFQCATLLDIWALDFPTHTARYQVNYCLLSTRFNIRIILQVRMEEPTLPSVVSIFNSANWLEREVWDMHGIFFANHPDLRRILTDYGFEGFPLLKDFPLSGYTEIRYDEEVKSCIQEPINASQEYRYFDFLSPWVARKTHA